MTDELFIEGARYISAADAAEVSNLTRDYIARLAREGKIVGRQVARQWYVNQESMQSFLMAQEYANSQRRGALTRERQQEYERGQTVGAAKQSVIASTAIPLSSQVPSTANTAVDLHRRLVNAAMSSGAQAVSKATALAGNATSQVPLYAVTPGFELLHKIAAAVLALVLVVGLYSAEGSLISSSPEFVPGTNISPSEELTAAGGFLGNTFGQIADGLERGADALLAPLYGVHLAQGGSSQGIVAVNISPKYYAAPANTPVVSTQRTVQQTIVENPVIERVVQSQNVIASGGITQSELDQQLQELDNSLTQKITTLTSANSTAIAQNYNVTAQTNAIDELTNTTITTPSISGGSIANAAISGGTIFGANISGATFTGTTTLEGLVTTGSATSSFAAGIDLAGGCFAISGTCLSGGGAGNPGGSDTQVQFNDGGVFNGSSLFTFDSTTGTLSVANASTTNATSTNLYSSSLVAGNATTTNLYVSGAIGLGSALPVSSGGTGTSTAPSYGQLLVGNSSGGYSLAATSSLGITGGGGSSASSTLLTDNNTFTGGNLFLASTTIGTGSQNGGLTISGGATTTGNSYVGGNLGIGTTSAGSILSIQGVGNFVANATSTLYNSFSLGGNLTLQGISSSLLSTNASGQVVATTSIGTNLLTGTLGVANGGTGASSFSYGLVLSPGGTGALTNVATSSLGLLTTNVAEGTNLYFTNARAVTALTGQNVSIFTNDAGYLTPGTFATDFDSRLSATTSLPNITTLAGLSLPYSQLTGTPNISGYPFALSGNATSTLTQFNGGLTAFASSTIGNGNQNGGLTVNGGATTTGNLLVQGSATTTNLFSTTASSTNLFSQLATLGTLNLKNLSSALLGVNSSGQVVSTTSVGTNYLTGALGTINGTTFNAGGSITVASSTLLGDNNTFSGNDTFSSLITGSVSGNAGTATALQNARTINGVSFNGTANIVIAAASSTLLSDNSTFSGNDIFSNLLNLTAGLTAFASSTIGNGSQNGGLTVFGGATTTGNALVQGTFNVNGQTTLDNASTTVLSVSGNSYLGTGQASAFSINSIISCAGSQALQTDGSGNVSCGAISVGGASAGGGWIANGGSVNGTITESTSTYLVAIGATSTPYAKFSVLSGSAATTTFALVPASAQTANILDIYAPGGGVSSVFTAGGSFGIGSTSPSATLSVNGNVYVTGTTTITGPSSFANATSTGFAITNLASSLLAVNANGSVIATSSIGTNLLTGTLGVPNGGTGSTTLTGILKGNGTGGIQTAVGGTDYEFPLTFSTGLNRTGNAITNTGVLSLGTGYATTTGTSIALSTTTQSFNGLTIAQTITSPNGSDLLFTPTISGTLANSGLAHSTIVLNGTTLTLGDAADTITAASSTLLGDNNTFSGNNTFSSLITGSVSGNAGTATALQNARTINGVSFDGTANIIIAAASSTLLANNNTWTGLQNFANASSTLTTLGTTWFNGLTNALLSTNANGQVVATTSIGVNYLTGILPIANGGSNASSFTSGQLLSFDGTRFVSTSTIGNNQLANSSIALSNGGGLTVSGSPVSLGGTGTISLDLTHANSWTGLQTFANASTTLGTFATTWFTSNTGSILSTNASGLVQNTSVTYPLQFSGSTLSTAFGTTTNNTFAGTQTFGNLIATNATTTSLYVTGVTSHLLKTDANGQVVSAIAGTDYQVAGTYLTGLGNYATTTASAISISTSTVTANGQTLGLTVVASANGLLFTPTISGTLNNAGLTNSSLTVSSGSGLTGGGSVSLGGSTSLSLDLTHANNWTGLQTFTNASSSLFSVTNTAYFGGTATTTIDNAGNIVGAGTLSAGTTTLTNLAVTNVSTSTFAGGLTVGASNFVVQQSTGFVGIGTTSPTNKLEVAGNTFLGGNLTATGTATIAGLTTFNSGFLSNASSTFTTGLLSLNGGATTTALTVSGPTWFTAAGLASALLSTDANGKLVATTSIGTNLLTGTLATINSTAITAGGSFTITAASSTLLTDNNTFSGNDIFSNLLTMTNGLIASASSTIGNGTQAGGLTIFGGATTTASAYFGGNIAIDTQFAAGIALNLSTTSTVAARGASITNTYVGGGSVATQGINAFAFSQGTANNTVTTSGGGLRNRYIAGNETVGYNVAQMSALSAFTEAFGTLSSTTNATDFNAEVPSITAGNTITNFQGVWVHASAVSGLTNQAGVDIENLTAATNNTELLLGTSTIPSGNYGLYQADTGNDYFGGNVGIGTTTPGSLLSLGGIANFTTATSTFYSTGGINLSGGCFSINGTCLGGSSGSGTVNAGTQGQFAFYATNGTTVSGTSTLFVTQAGNVGVGTTTPGVISGANQYLTINSNGADTEPALELSGNSNIGGAAVGRISFYNQVGTDEEARISSVISNTDSGLGSLTFSTGNDGVTTEVGRFDSSGNFGIGTTSPGSILSISGVGNFVGGATSTLYNGLNLTGGCVAVNGTCLTSNLGTVTSIVAGTGLTGGTITTSGTIALDLTHANNWTGLQSFANASTTIFSNIGVAYFGGTATTTIDSAGNIVVGGSLTANGNVTLGNATTTNLFSTTASSTNLFAQTASLGSLTLPSLSGLLQGNGTSPITAVSGTAGQFPYFNGTNTVLATSSLFLSSSGNIGIGTTSPYALLSLSANNGSTNTTLFQISSSTLAGTATTSLLSFNNSGQLAIGPNIAPVSSSAQLSILAGTTTVVQAGSVLTSASPGGVFVQGRYAYVKEGAKLEIFDVSDPTSMTSVGSTTAYQTPDDFTVNGRYAYFVEAQDLSTPGTLEIFDVSDPAAPFSVATTSTGKVPSGVYIQGRYAYVTNKDSNTFQIFDISNPVAPVSVTTVTTGSSPQDISVQGRYAYVTDGNGLEAFDVSDPANPIVVGAQSAGTGTVLYVQGRYAYVIFQGSNALKVFDISNPASIPAAIGTVTTGSTPTSVYVQGRYAFVTNNGSHTLQIFDVSNPTAPFSVGLIPVSGIHTNSAFVSGRYAYAVSSGSGGSSLLVSFDLGGAYIQQLEAGGLEAGTLVLRNNLQSVDGEFSGGLTIGSNLNVGGSFALSASTFNATTTAGKNYSIFSVNTASSTTPILTALYNGNVGIGTTSPFAELSVFAGGDYGSHAASTLFAIGSSTAGTASSTLFSVNSGGFVGIGTTTPGSIFSVNGILNLTAATSTFYSTGGINLTGGGCFSINGTCVGGGTSGITTLGNYASTTGTAISLSTTTATVNGQTLGLTVQASANGILFTPTISGTLNNAGLTNSAITFASPNSTLSAPGSIALGSTANFDLNLGHSNWWTATQNFTNASTSEFTATSTVWFTSLTNALLSTDANGKLVATTSVGVNYLTGILPIANGGTNQASQTTNGVNYFDGTHITSGSSLTFNGTNFANSAGSVTGTQLAASAGSGTSTIASGQGFTIGGSQFVLQQGSGNVGIGSSNPTSLLSLAGGNFTQTPGAPTQIWQSTNASSTSSVYIQGHYAYVMNLSTGPSDMQIYDIANPASPTLVSTYYNTGQGIQDIVVSGKYAYIDASQTSCSGPAPSACGMIVLDVSNPSNPTFVGRGGSAGFGLVVSGKYAYTADGPAGGSGSSGLAITDISNPTNPTLAGSVNFGLSGVSSNSLYVSGEYAYLANGESANNSGLNIIDVSNPNAPVVVGAASTTGSAISIYVSGKYAYVGESGASFPFQVFDISNPATPTVVGSFTANAAIEAVYVSGHYAYLGEHTTTGGIQVVDVSNPASPVAVASANLPVLMGQSFGHNLLVSGKYLYVADKTNTTSGAFLVYDISGINSPSATIGNINTSDLTVDENTNIGGDLFLNGGLNAGLSGIFSRGGLSVFVASSTASNPIAAEFMGGNVGIGTTTPGATFTVAGAGCFAKTTGGIGCSTATVAGDIYYGAAHAAGGFDVAEQYAVISVGPTVPGTIVGVDYTGTTTLAVATTSSNMIGIVSSNPGLTFGNYGSSASTTPLALSGRVPVKVTLQNGAIQTGDRITLSPTPGVGMKAGPLDPSVGIALEPYTAISASSSIMVFVTLQRGLDPQAIGNGLLGSSTSATSTPGVITPFLSSLFSQLTQWFASAANGIHDLYATVIHAQEVDTQTICVSDSTGAKTCITKAQLDALLANAAGSQGGGGGSSSGSSVSSSGGSSSTPSAPVLQVNGDNPATVQVGAVYNDLGATITGPVGDTNLGISASVDGGATTTSDQIQIDTSQVGTHTIIYTATDQNGLTGSATRTLNVAAPELATPSDASSSSDTTSTDPGSSSAPSTDATSTGP